MTNIFQWKTMRLTESPEGIGTNMYKAWATLFSTWGFGTIHPLEARGALMHAMSWGRTVADAMLNQMLDRGFAIAP